MVQQSVGGGEPACAFQVGIDCDGGEVLRFEGHVRFHLNILEAEYGKCRPVFVQAFPAEVLHLLKGSGLLFSGKLDVLLGEFSVLVHQLSETKEYMLSFMRVEPEGCIALDVLAEVQYGLA